MAKEIASKPIRVFPSTHRALKRRAKDFGTIAQLIAYLLTL